MAAGRYGASYGGAYPQGYGSYDSRFYSDYDAYGAGGSGGYDYDSSYGGGYWGQGSAGGDYEDPAAKKRKMSMSNPNLTVCVDHLRGYCAKGSRCPKAHVEYVESSDEREMMAKVKFCHDFQNKGVCTRQNCRFLHVTRREEDEFLLTGQIPQTVFERKNDYGDDDDDEYEEESQNFPPPRPPLSRLRGRGGWGSRGGGGPRGGHRPGPPNYSRGPSRDDSYGYGRSRYESSSSFEATKEGHSSSMPVTYSNFCIDFLKGTCSKGDKCQLHHVQMVEAIDDRENISKNVFCHDFLNWKCPRSFCKYIHATNDEQKVFIDHGYFTPALCQRNKEKLFYSDVCIDHMRNQCVRGDSCQYRHVSCVEEKEERVCLSRSLFCHDHQEGRCERYNCKLIHTDKNDESFFIRTGSLPDNLKTSASSVELDPFLESLAATVCREFVKNRCNRGPACKFYHPPADEVARLITYQRRKSTGGGNAVDSSSSIEIARLQQENKELKERAQQLERLLADACHCITLAVGDQNPAIQTLMQTIATMAPDSSLACVKTEGTTKSTEEETLAKENANQQFSTSEASQV